MQDRECVELIVLGLRLFVLTRVVSVNAVFCLF